MCLVVLLMRAAFLKHIFSNVTPESTGGFLHSACYLLSFRIFDSLSLCFSLQCICCLLPLVTLLLRLPFELQRPRPGFHPLPAFPGGPASALRSCPTLLSSAPVLSVPTPLLLPLQREINFLLYLSRSSLPHAISTALLLACRFCCLT